MPRILYITPEPPWPPTSGGRQRSNLLYRALSSFARVDTVCLRHEPDIQENDWNTLVEQFNTLDCLLFRPRGATGLWRHIRPARPQLADRLAHNLGRKRPAFAAQPALAAYFSDDKLRRYDAVVGRYVQALSCTGVLGRKPCFLDLDDWPAAQYHTRLASPVTRCWEKPLLHRHLRATERLMPQYLQQCAGIWVSKASDLQYTAGINARVLNNIPWAASAAAGTPPTVLPQNHRLLIVASFHYSPNVAAVGYFLRDIWPKIRAEAPQAEFRIAGSHMPDDLKQQWGSVQGVTVAGFVENIAEEYQQSYAVVVPVLSGGGTNIKVLEALSFARPCIISNTAHRGYEEHLHDGRSLLVADDAESFARQTLRLLNDRSLGEKLGVHGAQTVRQHYSETQFRNTVEAMVMQSL